MLVVCRFRALSAQGENWPQFRELTGLGHADDRDLPLMWNAKSVENVAWRKELDHYVFDGALGSSAILYGDTVILDCDQTGKRSRFIAFDKATGETRGRQSVPRLDSNVPSECA